MTSPEIPIPEKLQWSSRQWQEYVAAWPDNKPVSLALRQTCPGLFKERDHFFVINKRVERSHEVLSYATSLMCRYAIVQVCERLNIHPVDIAFSHDLRTASHRAPFMGTSDNALQVQLLLDKPSYSAPILHRLEDRLSHMLVDILKKRGVEEPCVFLCLDDVVDHPHGYTSPWRMGSSPDGLQQGLHTVRAVQDNPQVVHAWRSRAPDKFLTSAAAAGGLPQKGELYLRWLDGKERPENIAPVDEKAIEASWPSAMKFFHMWAALGIRERTALRDALSRLEPRNHANDSFELPAGFGMP